MANEVLNLCCRNCGAAVDFGTDSCKYCGSPISISTFNSVQDMALPLVNKYVSSYKNDIAKNPNDKNANRAMAYCYLKLKMYDKALSCFEKAIEDNFDDSELYFYTSICCLQGKKAYLSQRSQINKAEEYLNAAITIEPKGIYYYMWSYIKYDYYKRKFLNTTPNHIELLKMAKEVGVSAYDKKQLFCLLNVEKPNIL